MKSSGHSDKSRREFIKKAAYIAPVVLTLPAIPALARYGSQKVFGNNGIGQEKRGIIDGPPPGLQTEGDFNDNGTFAPIGQNGAPVSGGNPGPTGGQ